MKHEGGAPLKLTSYSKTAGCAAKIGQADLYQMLTALPPSSDDRLLVGAASRDDCAVVRLTDDLYLLESVDIFTPIVDDAYTFGQIAATNALSDIYAMGGAPLSALSFIAWPVAELGMEPAGRVLAGAVDVCTAAGISIGGGHSIVDAEPKFGLFVTGTVHPKQLISNAAVKPDDLLVLTKPLGTGILTTAAKKGLIGMAKLQPAIDSMVTLNKAAAQAMLAAQVQAATDVTGFGLLGHLGSMLRASAAEFGGLLGAEICFADVPFLPAVLELVEQGVCPGGSRKNLEYARAKIVAPGRSESQLLALADAQTSGGMLIAISAQGLPALQKELAAAGCLTCAVVGKVVAGDDGTITVS